MRLPWYAPLLLHQRDRGTNGGCGAESMENSDDKDDDCKYGCTTMHGKPNLLADSARGTAADGGSLASTMAMTVLLRAQAIGEDDAGGIVQHGDGDCRRRPRYSWRNRPPLRAHLAAAPSAACTR